jgi:hypothetical protein
MKFSIRDLLLVTVIMALILGWGLDRWSLREEVRRVEFLRTLEQVRTKALESIAKSRAVLAKSQADHAAFLEDLKRAREATRDGDYLDAPEGNLLGPPLPNSSSPASNPPKP